VLIVGSCTLRSSRLCFIELLLIVDPTIEYPLYKGFVHLGAGVACGMTGMAAGYAIGHVGDAVRVLLLKSYSRRR
jgi:ATP synthase proteolipid subunit